MTHDKLAPGTLQGRNDWGKNMWRGPCPPIGRHRYFFKLYALDTVLDVSQPDLVDLENAMEKHTLATAELMGTYEKRKKHRGPQQGQAPARAQPPAQPQPKEQAQPQPKPQ